MKSDPQGRELLQLIGEGFVLVDEAFHVVEMNAEAERIGGRSAAEMVGTSLWESWPGFEATGLGGAWEAAMRDRRPVAREELCSWPDGRQTWLETRAYPHRGGLAIFLRDVSDRKQAEGELTRTQAELIHAWRVGAMGTMAATLAHELAQPLTTIQNYLDVAIKTLRPLPAAQAVEARRALSLGAAAVDRASGILKRLRKFVAKERTEPESHDLQSIIADAGVLVLPQAQREGVEIAFRLDRRARWVRADDVQIQQVLVNLMKNAIEAMKASAQRQITVSTATLPAGAVEVAVEDSGPGFAEDVAERLFSPFHTTKPGGLGVGLSISRTIVEAHGGTIGAEQAEGGGAVFRFTLPRGQEPD